MCIKYTHFYIFTYIFSFFNIPGKCNAQRIFKDNSLPIASGFTFAESTKHALKTWEKIYLY